MVYIYLDKGSLRSCNWTLAHETQYKPRPLRAGDKLVEYPGCPILHSRDRGVQDAVEKKTINWTVKDVTYHLSMYNCTLYKLLQTVFIFDWIIDLLSTLLIGWWRHVLLTLSNKKYLCQSTNSRYIVTRLIYPIAMILL